MDDDLRLISAFFNSDEELKGNVKRYFYRWSDGAYDETVSEIFSILDRRLDLTDEQQYELRFGKTALSRKLSEKFLSSADEYVYELNKISISPEELTKGEVKVTEDTYDHAVMHTRRIRCKLDELEDKDIVKRSSGSCFSNLADTGVNLFRNYIDENLGSEAVRKFDYYCEPDVKDNLEYGTRAAINRVYKQSQDDLDDLHCCTRRMNDYLGNSVVCKAEELLK